MGVVRGHVSHERLGGGGAQPHSGASGPWLCRSRARTGLAALAAAAAGRARGPGGGALSPRRGDAAAWWPEIGKHTSELQSRGHLVCRLLLEKKNDIYLVL